MRYLFVGGPGRSGTSFVADRLGTHPQVAALKDIELKLFCEKNGLLDLHHALVETYSPNRAVIALDQFRHMTAALVAGKYGQPALGSAAPAAEWGAIFEAFTARLLEDGHPAPQTAEHFLAAARGLLAQIAQLACRANELAAGADVTFLEKTPHSLLAMGFLARLAPGARFLHVMRDPRAIAWSLLAMPWGPDRLVTAAAWVNGYCRAWAEAEAEAASLGVNLVRLHIEDVAAAPEAAADWLTAGLDLGPRRQLFQGVNPDVLNRGAAQLGADDRALLDQRLGGWAEHFGYAPANIGQRTAPAFTPSPGTGGSAGSEEPVTA